MVACKRCGGEQTVKNGKVRGKARYKCKQCSLNFVEGDKRVNALLVVKKALAVILYSLGKVSFNMLGKIFGHSRSLMYRWIVEEMAKLPEPAVAGDIKEMGMRCGTSSGQKTQNLDHQGSGSWHRANCCLDGRRS